METIWELKRMPALPAYNILYWKTQWERQKKQVKTIWKTDRETKTAVYEKRILPLSVGQFMSSSLRLASETIPVTVSRASSSAVSARSIRSGSETSVLR